MFLQTSFPEQVNNMTDVWLQPICLPWRHLPLIKWAEAFVSSALLQPQMK